MDGSPPGSSVHGIPQERILEQVAMLSYRASSQPRIEPVSLMSPALTGVFFTSRATWEAQLLSLEIQNISIGKVYLWCYQLNCVHSLKV